MESQDWTYELNFQWSLDISKLLGTPFGLDITTEDVDKFLMTKIDKKLVMWSNIKVNSVGRVLIANCMIVSTMLFFLAIWGGSSTSIQRITAKIRDYLWSG